MQRGPWLHFCGGWHQWAHKWLYYNLQSWNFGFQIFGPKAYAGYVFVIQWFENVMFTSVHLIAMSIHAGMPSLSLVTSWSLCASGFCLKNWTIHQMPQNSHLVPRKYSGYVLHTESVHLHAVYYYFHVHTSRGHKASSQPDNSQQMDAYELISRLASRQVSVLPLWS